MISLLAGMKSEIDITEIRSLKAGTMVKLVMALSGWIAYSYPIAHSRNLFPKRA
ncbi:hypothetical protein [uncultured Eudoraea sp.]|uniref:hypothetical protein n=1 Tax=uncultured Eudoraea sp. TaxID=1035614 RepID=UPI002639374A|nr:hypothetical protein [uncultured Eudoraea sp.]